jgi:integrase
MKIKLTNKHIEALTVPEDMKRIEIFDVLVPGLSIRVSKTGQKRWAHKYRHYGKQRRKTLGIYPALSLSDARQIARDLYVKNQIGELELTVPSPTLSDALDDYETRYVLPRLRDHKGCMNLLRNEFGARYGHKPTDQLKKADILIVLDAMIDRGAPTRANRALSAIRRFCNWCIERDVLETSPCQGLKAPSVEIARDRVLTSEELTKLWSHLDTLKDPFGPCTKILILTGQRRGEVRGMKWTELDFDKKLWTLDGSRTKNGRAHVVPLTDMTVEIIKKTPCLKGCDYVFSTTGKTPISGFGKVKQRMDEAIGVDDWRIHDIRRTVASGMAELGVAPHVIEKVLNHSTGVVSGVAAVYNRHAYKDEMRSALETWMIKISTLQDLASTEPYQPINIMIS